MQDPIFPPPIPVTPLPGPLPVQPLSYSLPSRQGRPGVVTAIGVISIVVAGLSFLFSLQSGFQAVGMFILSRMPMPAGTTTTTSSGSVVISTSVSASGVMGPSPAPTTNPAPLPTTAPPTALTPAEVQQVISKVQASLGSKKLNTAQVATLTAALQDPLQQLVLPGTAWSPVTSTSMQSNGTAIINLSGGSIPIDAQGLGSPLANANPMAGFSQISIASCILVAFESVVSLGLAVLLLIAGILTLRYSPRSPRLHRIYAWAKIPIAILGGVGTAWMMNQMFGIGGPAPIPGAKMAFAAYATFMAAFACAYPIALLITLRSRTVRSYYNSISEAGG